MDIMILVVKRVKAVIFAAFYSSCHVVYNVGKHHLTVATYQFPNVQFAFQMILQQIYTHNTFFIYGVVFVLFLLNLFSLQSGYYHYVNSNDI